MKTKQKRPKFLNLLQIRLPVTGVNSIAHRISGALLFLAVPGFIYLFNLSLKDAESFAQFTQIIQSTCFKLVVTVLAWAIGHHLLAGIRFLLTDLDVGTSLAASRRFAWSVNIAGVVVFVLIAMRVWS